MALNNFLVLLLLLTVATIANARVDFLNKVSEHVFGSGTSLYRPDPSLECCDNCQCDVSAGYCTCLDWTRDECTPGCVNCVCALRKYPLFCNCKDKLDSCPRTCSESLLAALKS